MMSESRRSSSSSRPRHRRSRFTRPDEDSHSDDSLNGDRYSSSRREERRRRRSRSPDRRDHSRSQSYASSLSERTRAYSNPPDMDYFVKRPIPSLLSPTPLLSSGRSGFVKEVKVVQNKSGLDRKGRMARSLMDLHFEDRTERSLSTHHVRDRNRASNGMPGLLPDPIAVLPPMAVLPPQMPPHMMEADNAWLTPKESRKTLKKRSWRESEGSTAPSSHHSLFSSRYKPLVIESEPKRKMSKLPAVKSQPRPLLETEILPLMPQPLHKTQAVPIKTAAPPVSLLKRDSPGDHQNTDNSKAATSIDDHRADKVKAYEPIVSFESADEENAVYLVIPSSLPWVHLHGRARIRVLRGLVYILAHTLEPDTSYDVYSPSSSCLLSLQAAAESEECMSPREVRAELEALVKGNSEFAKLSEKSIGIIKMTRLESVVTDYVTRLPPFTKLFYPPPPPKDRNEANTPLGVTLLHNTIKVAPESEMSEPCMMWDDLYNEALDKWLETIYKGGMGEESPVLLTCGAKDAGKSTFTRCVINTTLRSVPELAYIDCDVGQTEFSPPSTVSLHIIRKAVLSPPFCHQRLAEKMVFYGDMTPAHDPSLYVDCMQVVVDAYRKMAAGRKLPLIVNTMGFPEGIGYMLMIDTLNLTRPDLVIQFSSEVPHANFPRINQEMVALDEGWTYNKSPPSDIKARIAEVKEHFLFMLPSLNLGEKTSTTTNNNPVKLHPSDLRNLTMLCGLSMGLGRKETLMSLTPHTVPYARLAIHVCRYNLTPGELLVAVDACIVALCRADCSKTTRHAEDLPLTFNKMPICDCLGFGIVRGVDTENRLLYISTTLPRHLLKGVNTILKGTQTLPDHFIMGQKDLRHQVPYIDILSQATATRGSRARSRMPRLHAKAKTFFGL